MKHLLIVPAALAALSMPEIALASNTVGVGPGFELEITPETAPPYFDLTQTEYVSGFALFPAGYRVKLTATKYASGAPNPYVSPAPTCVRTGSVPAARLSAQALVIDPGGHRPIVPVALPTSAPVFSCPAGYVPNNPAPDGSDFVVGNVMSAVTKCGDTMNFVIEQKQGQNTFYVITMTTQQVKINC